MLARIKKSIPAFPIKLDKKTMLIFQKHQVVIIQKTQKVVDSVIHAC